MSREDNFLRRLFWISVAVVAILLVWQLLPWIERSLTGPTPQPRAVTPRGDLAADEKATIEIFERAKGSVVYISTQQRVMDPWTRNVLPMALRGLLALLFRQTRLTSVTLRINTPFSTSLSTTAPTNIPRNPCNVSGTSTQARAAVWAAVVSAGETCPAACGSSARVGPAANAMASARMLEVGEHLPARWATFLQGADGSNA